MDNKRILKYLEHGIALMNLHEVNPFKVRVWDGAVAAIEASAAQVSALGAHELEDMLGKNMAQKVSVLLNSGAIPEVEEFAALTPSGVQDMMAIKGLGPKKLRTLWKEHQIESLEQLQAACEANQIAQIKGFGEKTQANILQALQFAQSNKGKLHLASAIPLALYWQGQVAAALGASTEQGSFPAVLITGQVLQQADVVDKLELLVVSASDYEATISALTQLENLEVKRGLGGPFTLWYQDSASGMDVVLHLHTDEAKGRLLTGATSQHMAHKGAKGVGSLKQVVLTQEHTAEEGYYAAAGLPYIIPAMRQGHVEWQFAERYKPEDLIQVQDLKGVLHNHSTWSDGAHTVAEMAQACKDLGWSYLGMADHSQTAFYANGLKAERVALQQKEIDQLNALDPSFTILKGIESDILSDGSLDYPDEVLATFDYVVASVHSVLNMDRVKATDRLINAIQNPYTTVLGHSTGRLLLRREGYSFDVPAIIEACKAHEVMLELNANPWRLDVDWRWLWQIQEAGVLVSINPDAHSQIGLQDVNFGVLSAQKGGLLKSNTFNAMDREAAIQYLAGRKRRRTQA